MNPNRLSLADKSLLNKQKLILSSVEKLKRDIEAIQPKDSKAELLINELLYYFAWKVNEPNEPS